MRDAEAAISQMAPSAPALNHELDMEVSSKNSSTKLKCILVRETEAF